MHRGKIHVECYFLHLLLLLLLLLVSDPSVLVGFCQLCAVTKFWTFGHSNIKLKLSYCLILTKLCVNLVVSPDHITLLQISKALQWLIRVWRVWTESYHTLDVDGFDDGSLNLVLRFPWIDNNVLNPLYPPGWVWRSKSKSVNWIRMTIYF